MHVRSRLVLSLSVAAGLGCAGDRATAPSRDDAVLAAAEFERVAAELGGASPTAVLTYSSAASALRSGAAVSRVSITIDGVAEEWSAFGHEVQFELPPGSAFQDLTPPPPLRALLAWRRSASGLRMIHLLSADDDGPIGRFLPHQPTGWTPSPGEYPFAPSYLMYGENRELFWQAISGSQTSRLVSTGAACLAPSPRAMTPPAPSCVEASFSFGFSGVETQPLDLRLGLGSAPPAAVSGTRTLSMASQAVAGVKLEVTLAAFALPPIASRATAP